MDHLCDICKTIEIDKLPHEEDNAIRHHTYLELGRNARKSNEQCKLCLVVYQAVILWWQFLRESTTPQCTVRWNGAYVPGPVPEYIDHDMRVWIFGKLVEIRCSWAARPINWVWRPAQQGVR
jgi:hypothetical protein